MKPRITIIDYGIGNLFSVGRAFEVCGGEVVFATEPNHIESATHLVLPGVGAFESGMAGLRERKLIEPIRAYASEGKPLLGICLGMQLFATDSEEFGQHEGLNIIPGRVLALPQTTVEGAPLKIPHIGWSGLHKSHKFAWENSPFSQLNEGDAVYLVHSFAVQTDDPAHQIAHSRFGGHSVCTVIRKNSIIGCQFHPEKSGPIGIKVLRGFLNS